MKIIHSADWHLGHTRVPTNKIITNLKNYLYPQISENNLVIIAGDVFHRNLNLGMQDSRQIISFFIKLFQLLEKNYCTLRILKGTNSHDHSQIGILVSLYRENNFTFSFKYIETIKLEYIKKYNKRFLYLPDDLPMKNANHIIKVCKDKLSKLNWDSVNYVIGHGTFDFTLPIKVSIRIIYTLDMFDFVEDKILMGHIHKPQKRNSVIYSGSFDKLAHGEKGKRGFFIIDNDQIKFIENKDAAVFEDITYKESFDNLDTLIPIIDQFYKSQNYYGFLRFINCNYIHKSSIMTYFHDNYPDISISFVNSKYLNKNLNDISNKLFEYNNVSNLEIPTKANLPLILSEFIDEKYKKLLPESRISEYLQFGE